LRSENDRRQAGGVGGEHFSAQAPIGSTRPCSVTSPVMPTVLLTGRPVSSDASAVTHRHPRLGPLGDRAGGHVDVKLAAVERSLVDPQLRRVALDVG